MPTAPRLSIFHATGPLHGDRATHAGRIRALYAALHAGDLRAVLARLAPGVEWEADSGEPALPIRRRHMGRGAVERLLSDPLSLPRATEIVHIAESGPEVAVLAAEGPSPEPGHVAPLRLEAHLWTLDDNGLVTRVRQISAPLPIPTRH